MISVFDVSLAHFAVVDGRALARKGVVRLGQVGVDQLRSILISFRDVMPIQDFEGEPEVLITTRLGKWKVHSDLGKLLLYDLQKPQMPGISCAVEQLISEVDERAIQERRALLQNTQHVIVPVLAEDPETPGAAKAGAKPESRRLVALLSVIACLLVALVVFQARQQPLPPPPPLREALLERDDPEQLCRQVAGVYMTGNPSLQHGIVVNGNGSLRLIQFNGLAAPLFVEDAYQLGYQGRVLCLFISQPGAVIRVRGRDTLEYCGESYSRVN